MNPSPREPDNLNVALHIHVIINKLCPHFHLFDLQQNKNNAKSAWLQMTASNNKTQFNKMNDHYLLQ